MEQLTIIAFTHKTTTLHDLSRFYLHDENHDERLKKLKILSGISELLYISTCNRIEFVFTLPGPRPKNFVRSFFRNFRDDWNEENISFAVSHAQVFENESAVRHLMEVASSLDSMVVGEREIITQVRNAFERCRKAGLTGDLLRLLIKNVIITAKEVYTRTKVSENPVSVVSLAFRKLRAMQLPRHSRFLVVGAGETNGNLLKYLYKHGYRNFSIFNRTPEKAVALADSFRQAEGECKGYALSALAAYQNGFDILISCTGAADPIISAELYASLLQNDEQKKILVDLAVPADIHPEVITKFAVRYVGLNELKEEAEKNLRERESEVTIARRMVESGIEEFREQLHTREVELKMRAVPAKIREIKSRAMNDVFANEIRGLDDHSKEVLFSVMDYMEKKCISVPMIMAKEILLSK